MNKIILPLLFLLCASFSLFGQEDMQPTEEEAVLECVVTDPDKVPEEDAQIMVESEDKTIVKNGKTNIDGIYKALVPEGKKYNIKVKKFGKFLDYSVDIPNHPGAAEFVQPLIIVTVKEYIREYTLKHVNFDTNKWDIRQDAHHTLNKLYHGFNKNPKLIVEIAGHTDDIGDAKANLRLSQKRADAIRAYLIERGVSPDRVLAKGYGEIKPHADNKTEEGRALNRRTEVKVIAE
jgi:outer membrane protein OmpA-like peptidoglycan-associated protein